MINIKIKQVVSVLLVLSMMITGIFLGTERTVYANTQDELTLSLGTDGESAPQKPLCTENGFSLLPGGRFAVSLYDLRVGDYIYYYNKKNGLSQKFKVLSINGNQMELIFADHFNEMESVTVSNGQTNGFPQAAFLERYNNWAVYGAGGKYFYQVLTEEQKSTLKTQSTTYDFISNGMTVFGITSGTKKNSSVGTANGVFRPLSLQQAENVYKNYNTARTVLNLGQPYYTASLAGYMTLNYSSSTYDVGEFMWCVGADGSIFTKLWSGSSYNQGYGQAYSFTGLIIPSFSIDIEKWEQLRTGYLYEGAIFKAQTASATGISPSSSLGVYNDMATERLIKLSEASLSMVCPYDGINLSEIPVGKTITLPYYNASGIVYNADSPKRGYITAIIVGDNKVKYYGRLAASSSKQGEVRVTIPTNLILGEKHKLILFEETASNLDSNAMSIPQVMYFTPVSSGQGALNQQQIDGTCDGVHYKGEYSIRYDAVSGKDLKYAENLYVTEGADNLVNGGVLAIPETIKIGNSEYVVSSIGGGIYGKPFVPKETEFKRIRFSGSVNQINPYAFYNSKIEELAIDAIGLKIGSGAFGACERLRAVGLKIIGGSIGTRAFAGNGALETVNLEGSISVGAESFLGCNNLTALIIKKLVGTIYERAFEGVGITELYIPNSVSVAGYGFSDCKSLRVVETDMNTLGNNVFYNCPSITRIVLDENVQSVRENWGGYEAVGSNGKKIGERRFIYAKNPHTNFYFSKHETGANKGVLSSFGARSGSDYYYNSYRDVTVFYNKTNYPVSEGYTSDWSAVNDRIYTEAGFPNKYYMNLTAMADNYRAQSLEFFNTEMYRTGKTGLVEKAYALNVSFERASASSDAWAKALYEGKASYIPKSYQIGIDAVFSGVVREKGDIPKSRFEVKPVYSDAALTKEKYSENEFYILKTADYEKLSEAEKTKEKISGLAGTIAAGQLPNGVERGSEALTIIVFLDDKCFSVNLSVPVVGKQVELSPSDEYGSSQGVESALQSLKKEHAALEQILNETMLTKESLTQELEHEREALLASDNALKEKEDLLDAVNIRLNEITVELEATKEFLEEKSKELEATKATLGEKNKELEDTKVTLDEKNKELEDTKVTLDEKNKELDETKVTLDGKNKELEDTKVTLEEKDKELEDTKVTLDEKYLELEEKNEKLEDDLKDAGERILELETAIEDKDKEIAELKKAIEEHVCKVDSEVTPPVNNNHNEGSGGTNTGNNSLNSSTPSSAEYMSLLTQLFDYRQKVNEVENRNNNLIQELSNLKGDILSAKQDFSSEISLQTSTVKHDLIELMEQEYATIQDLADLENEIPEYEVPKYEIPEYEISEPKENEDLHYEDYVNYDTKVNEENNVEKVKTADEAPVHVADITLNERAKIIPMGAGTSKDKQVIQDVLEERDLEDETSELEEIEVLSVSKPAQKKPVIHVDLKTVAKGISLTAAILATYAFVIKRKRKKHYEELKSFLE